MDWKETFEDLWWGSFDNNGEKNSHEYEKMVSFIENFLEQERKRIEDESIALSPPEYIREPMMVSAFNDGVRAVLSIIKTIWTEEAAYNRKSKKEPLSVSYKVTCGRCEKSIKHSCGIV